MKVDFYRHDLGRQNAEAIAAVLASPFLTTGRVCRSVEDQLCGYFSVPHAVLCNSWTNGAVATLLALGIGPGDEVIVPAQTFSATANVVTMTGATPVFADVDPETLLLRPNDVEKLISAKTRAIIPVHLYGQMADIAGLKQMIANHRAATAKIWLIEDAAHCFEGTRDGHRPGQQGDAAIFSFYATKNVTCGEGGAIILHDSGLHERILETRLHGMSALAVDRFAAGRYNPWDMKRLGTKANLPDLLAALLPDQIATINERLPKRLELAERYRKGFSGGPLKLPRQIAGVTSAEHIFPVAMGTEVERDAALAAMNNAGIGVTVNYRAVPDTTFYQQHSPHALAANPVSVAWGRATLTLPLFPSLTQAEQDYVIEVVRRDVYPLVGQYKSVRAAV